MKSILVTGSSSGFGYLTVKTLAKDGHLVFATMRDIAGKNKTKADELKKWAEKNKYNVHVLELDVTSDVSVNEAMKKAIGIAKKLDVVVNNAGIGVMGIMESVTIEQAKLQYDINVFGVLRVNKAVLPHMRKEKSGLIIHISSGLGRVVMPYLGVYTSTKFAIEAIAETYHYELKSLGIDSVIVQPGAYATEFMKNGIYGEDAKITKEYGKLGEGFEKFGNSMSEMLKNAPDPQEIADAVKEYVDMPSGKRPLRINRGMMSEGAGVINETCAKVQENVLKHLGI